MKPHWLSSLSCRHRIPLKLYKLHCYIILPCNFYYHLLHISHLTQSLGDIWQRQLHKQNIMAGEKRCNPYLWIHIHFKICYIEGHRRILELQYKEQASKQYLLIHNIHHFLFYLDNHQLNKQSTLLKLKHILFHLKYIPLKIYHIMYLQYSLWEHLSIPDLNISYRFHSTYIFQYLLCLYYQHKESNLSTLHILMD